MFRDVTNVSNKRKLSFADSSQLIKSQMEQWEEEEEEMEWESQEQESRDLRNKYSQVITVMEGI